MRQYPGARRALLLSVVLLLGACGAPQAGLQRPPDGFRVPVDPVYGTPAPGSHPIF